MLRPHLAASLVLAGPAAWRLPAMVSPAPLKAQQPRFTVGLEAGLVWQTRNVAEAPNDGTATRFSLRGLLGSGPWPA